MGRGEQKFFEFQALNPYTLNLGFDLRWYCGTIMEDHAFQVPAPMQSFAYLRLARNEGTDSYGSPSINPNNIVVSALFFIPPIPTNQRQVCLTNSALSGLRAAEFISQLRCEPCLLHMLLRCRC